jgi:hypothetical protein
MTWLWGVAVLVSTVAGFGAGWGLKPDSSSEALQASTEQIATLNEGTLKLVEEVQKVAIEEAERETMISDKLTSVPPQCIPEIGGDPLSANCAWAWCVRTGETDKQRCEQGKWVDLLIEEYTYQAKKACED